MALKGIGLTIFIFVGAITMTFLSVQIIMMDSNWHLGQRAVQAASIESLRLYHYDFQNSTDPFMIPEDLTLNVSIFLTIGGNLKELEHALIGLSPSSYLLWFMAYFFLFLILGGIIGYLLGETDINPLLLVGFMSFVLVGAVVTTFIAVYIIVIDAQFHLRSLGTQMFLLETVMPDIFSNFLAYNVLINWQFFEHTSGQSASSYVDWFILFIIIYPIAAAVLIWILKRR
ncbi:MAG: hypothetical protein ACFFCM_20130 [Promethearchaeota archaeon]